MEIFKLCHFKFITVFYLFQQMDELTLSLTGGTNGYKIQLRDLYIRGASNYTVEDIKLGSPFQAKIRMPALILDAHYSRYKMHIIQGINYVIVRLLNERRIYK